MNKDNILEKLEASVTPRQSRSAVISYRTTPEIKDTLKEIANRKEMSMGEMMTEALIKYLK